VLSSSWLLTENDEAFLHSLLLHSIFFPFLNSIFWSWSRLRKQNILGPAGLFYCHFSMFPFLVLGLRSLVCNTETYRMSGWLGSELNSVGNYCMHALSSLNAFCYLVPHSKMLEPLNTMKKGKLRSASFDMNMFKAAILSVNFWTSFLDYRGFLFIIALILLGLALIPFTDTKHPSTFPLCTPNTHFSRLSFNWAPRMFVKVSAKSFI
jgi:hypothetical protein